jgi:diguanylate cyclase (GGDEF)-like protein
MGRFSVGRALIMSALIGGALVALYLWQLEGLKPRGGDKLALWPLVALGVWAAYVQMVPIRNRKFSVSVALSEIPVLVAIVFLTPVAAILAVSLGQLAASTQRRLRPVKALISWLFYLSGVSVGMVVYYHGIGSATPISARGWLMSVVAVALINIVDLVLLLVVMGIADQRWRRPPLPPMLWQLGVGIAACTAGGLVAVCLVSVNTWGVVLFVAMTVAANLAYRTTVASGQRYANLEKLYEFTRRLSSLVEARDVITTVLEEARALLSADRAELVAPLEPPLDRLALCCSLRGDGPAHFEEGAPRTTLDQLIRERGSLLLTLSNKDKRLADAMTAEGLSEGLAAPLQRDDPGSGYLLVADRAFKHEGFKKADLRFFEALAANTGVALRSSELLEKLRREAAIRQHQAHHDELTSLPNRVLFTERLEGALDRAATEGRVAVMLIDLDGFKEVNDTLGHGTGDTILREIARRLGALEERGDLVARLGGDEFAVLVSAAPDEATLFAQAEGVVSSICEPLAADGLLLDIRASLGMAVFPEHAGHATGLMRCADVAMYAAKGAGGGVRLYDVAGDRSTPRRLRLATELRRAIEAEALDVWYQPVVELGTGKVISCEALLRWSHDQFGPIPPAEFIPVAESAGLIDPLTWWVLEVALKQVKAWRLLVPGLTMAVNLSARSLLSMDIAKRLGSVIEHAGLEPGVLTLELTESSTIADPVGSERVLLSLRDLGVNLSIDDFGTGYSSLSRLKRLPFRELKIDKSFVKEMVNDKGDEAIVRSTIELARNLDRTVTAEGVEDQATLQRLATLHCDAAQGFFLARPLPPAQCETWLLAAPNTLTGGLVLPTRSPRRPSE